MGYPTRRLSSCIFKPGSHATHSFIFEQRRDRTRRIMEQPFALLPVHLKAAFPFLSPPLPGAPNNQRARYVRGYQHIMNVMDWLVSNPAQRFSVTDVSVNLACVLCAAAPLLHGIAFAK